MFDTVPAGHILPADRAHDFDALRQMIAGRSAWANIKPMPGRSKSPPFSG